MLEIGEGTDFLLINSTNAEAIATNIIIVPNGFSGRCNIGGSSDDSELDRPITIDFFLFGGFAGAIGSGSITVSSSGAVSGSDIVTSSGSGSGTVS